MLDGAARVEDMVLAAKADGQTELTQEGSLIGTASYLSPEQLRGELQAIGPPADIYSLGATLHALLVGRPAFEGDRQRLDRCLRAGPLPSPRACVGADHPPIPPALDALCVRAMALDPRDRFADAGALTSDHDHLLAFPSDLRYALGLGLRYRTIIGPIRLDLGIRQPWAQCLGRASACPPNNSSSLRRASVGSTGKWPAGGCGA
jgi:serine/threonine protein kinase